MKQAAAVRAPKDKGTAPRQGPWAHGAVRSLPEHARPSHAPADTRFGHDFSQTSVRPAAPMVGKNYATPACPVFPRACPFGGACHVCPAKVQTKLEVNRPGDKYEREADLVAQRVISVS